MATSYPSSHASDALPERGIAVEERLEVLPAQGRVGFGEVAERSARVQDVEPIEQARMREPIGPCGAQPAWDVGVIGREHAVLVVGGCEQLRVVADREEGLQVGV